MRILILILAVLILVLAGCSVQTITKYQCVDGSFTDSANLCSSKTCPETSCLKLDCASCPVKTETKVETKTVTEMIYVCADLTEVKNKDDCLKVDSEGWYEVKTFSGSDSNWRITEPFKINSKKWRFIIDCTGRSTISEFSSYSLSIYKPTNDDKYYLEMFVGDCDKSIVPNYIYDGPGEYFFKVGLSNVKSWTIKIEAIK